MSLPLVLASSSPRRRELLSRIGVPFEVESPEVDETPLTTETAVDYVARIAALKAEAIATRRMDALVLAADTSVVLGEEIMGQPADALAAKAMLERLFATSHRVMTAFHVRGPDVAPVRRTVITEVTLREPHEGELDGYLASGEWQNKAGGYALQGMAAAFVVAVRGSVTNVIGLPLAEVIDVLRQCGGPSPNYRAGRPA